MSETYMTPEVRELGALTALTLGSRTPGNIPFVKTNNDSPDLFTAFTGRTGEPCDISIPGDCNIP